MRPSIGSLIEQHFEKKEPFIYEKPDLFSALWETPSPLTVRTSESEAQKARLIQSGTALYEDLWRHMLTDILVLFFRGCLPYHQLKQMVPAIYARRDCDLDFKRILKPVVDDWPHKDSFGSPRDVVKHWFTEKLCSEVSVVPRPCPNADLQGPLARA